MKILVTGGAGYIGSITASRLLERGDDLIIIDNLSNSSLRNIDSLRKQNPSKVKFIRGEIGDKYILNEVFLNNKIDVVFHFAALKSKPDSIKNKQEYFQNNVIQSETLFECMKNFDVNRLIFSSSAAIYGNPNYLPIDEEHPINPNCPYSETKSIVEKKIRELAAQEPSFYAVSLRYFNPVGANSSLTMGENPKEVNMTSLNLMNALLNVIFFDQSFLEIYGSDYETPDGTPIRDYIHIEDLANAHILASDYLMSIEKKSSNQVEEINIGTGFGVSVDELVSTFELVNGINIPKAYSERREGDVCSSYASNDKAKNLLGWAPMHDLEGMCASAYKFIKNEIKT